MRLAAVDALLAQLGADALDGAMPALLDSDPVVRTESARLIGAFGGDAVVRLRPMIERSAGPSSFGPLTALAMTGPSGRQALAEFATQHPDPMVRKQAELLLAGRISTHEH